MINTLVMIINVALRNETCQRVSASRKGITENPWGGYSINDVSQIGSNQLQMLFSSVSLTKVQSQKVFARLPFGKEYIGAAT